MRKNTWFLTLAICMFLMVTLAPALMAEVRIVIEPVDGNTAVVVAENSRAFGFSVISAKSPVITSSRGPAIIKEMAPGRIDVAGFKATEVAIRGTNWRIVDPIAMDKDGKIGPALIIDNRLPVGFALAQNYPNPFNPETEISFSVPTAGPVELAIYNSLGQRVATLVNSNLQAGQHAVKWNANNGDQMTSGMYLYRLTIGGSSATRRMILLK